jgi:uncharacterized protein
MRIRLLLPVICLAVWSSPSFAADPPPSEASIRQLLDASQVRKTMDTMMGQMDQMMNQMMQQVTQGQNITPEVQKQIDASRAEVLTMVKEMLDWHKLEPMYIRVYQKSFSQKEVNDLIAMYHTPGAEAMINKMPQVMQNTMTEMQPLMQPVIERMRKTQQQVMAQIQAQKGKSG